MALAPAIEQGIRGAAIETENRAVAAEQGEVGNAAQVEHGARFPGCCEQGCMQAGRERRTLAAGGDITATQVADHIDPGQLGQQCAVE